MVRKLHLLSLFLTLFSPGILNAVFAQDILWEKTYGGIRAEYLFDVQPTADYGFILAGSSLSERSGDKTEDHVRDLDYWIWKMDEQGDLEWQRSFGGEGSDMLVSVFCTREGGYILAGNSTSPQGVYKKGDNIGHEDIWVIKLHPDGTEHWQKTLGGSERDIVRQVIQTRDGGYLLGGASDSPSSGDSTGNSHKRSAHYGSLDYWVVKLSAAGEVEWEKTYGGIYKDVIESIAQTEDGGYIAGGYSNSPLSDIKTEDPYGQGGDFWILKLDSRGDIEWQRTLGGDGDDHLSVIQPAREGGYMVGGSSGSGVGGTKSRSNGKGADFWVLRLGPYGEIVWEETYDFGRTDVLASLVENEDGTLLLGGYARSEVPMGIGQTRTDKKGIGDYIALKTDDKGRELWRRTVGSSGRDVLRRVVETRDEGYVLAGTSQGSPSRDKNAARGRSDFWVVKLRDKDKEEKERTPGLEAFPNPSAGYTNIIINHDFEKGTATVYDILGRQLQHFSIEHRIVPVNLSGLPEGVYIIEVKTDVKTESVKVLKGDK